MSFLFGGSSRRKSMVQQKGELVLPPTSSSFGRQQPMSSEDAKREVIETGAPAPPPASLFGDLDADGNPAQVRKTTSRRISQTQFGKPIKELPLPNSATGSPPTTSSSSARRSSTSSGRW